MRHDKRTQGFQNLHTGTGGQKLIEGLFQLWSWTTAKPEPDGGCDLLVTTSSVPGKPDFTFSAQIKTGESFKRLVTLDNDSANRLFAIGLPAFLFVVYPKTREVRWAYLEFVRERDQAFKDGGRLKVRLPREADLTLSSAAPSNYLSSMLELAKLQRSVIVAPTLAEHAKALRKSYQAIDSRLVVSNQWDGAKEVVVITPTGAPVSFQLSVVSKDPAAHDKLKRIVDWGEREVLRDCTATFTGSPLFDVLGLNKKSGAIELGPSPRWTGTAYLFCPDAQGSAFDLIKAIPLETTITAGREGAVLKLTRQEWFMLQMTYRREGKHKLTLSLYIDRLITGATLDFRGLKGMSALVNGILARAHLRLFLMNHPDLTEPLDLTVNFRGSPSEQDFRRQARSLEILEAIGALQTRFGFVLSEEHLRSFTNEDLEEWMRLGRVARGERVDLGQAKYRGTSTERLDLDELNKANSFVVENEVTLCPAGNEVGTLKTRAMLNGYYVSTKPADEGFVFEIGPIDEMSTCYLEEVRSTLPSAVP